MNKITNQIAKELSISNHPDLDEIFLVMDDIIGKVYSKESTCLVSQHPKYTPIVEEEEFDESDISIIRDTLISFIKNGPSKSLPSAFSILGKIDDESIPPILKKSLETYLEKVLVNHHILSQIVSALGKVEPEIISNGSFSSQDIEKNVMDSINYLKRNGKNFYV